MKKIAVILLFTCMVAPAHSADKVYEETISVSEITSIYDADTFRVNIKGWPNIVGERVPVRVLGIDAPEIKGKCEKERLQARNAKQFTIDKLRKARNVELRNVKRGKYFRLLADVYVDNKNLGDMLVSAGLARKYDGGTRGGWCH